MISSRQRFDLLRISTRKDHGKYRRDIQLEITDVLLSLAPIFLEDMYLITKAGVELLTPRVPYSAEEIEAAMSGASRP